MPSNEARGVIDGSLYFLLDGSRNITGPTTIINNVPQLASDVITIRGAAGQTGDLFVLQNSTPSDLVTFTSDGRQVSAFTLTGAASARYGNNYTLTLDATNTQTLGGLRVSSSIASDKSAADVRGIISRVTGEGPIGFAYGVHSTVSRASAVAQDEANGVYATTTHSGAGLLGFLGGVVGINTATGPSTTNAGLYFQTANVGAANANTYGAFVTTSNTGTISGSLTGARIEVAQTSGSAVNVYGVDISVSGAGSTSTQALRTTGAGAAFGGAVTITSIADADALKITANGTQTTPLVRVFKSDGTSELIRFNPHKVAGAAGQAYLFDTNATQTVGELFLVRNNGTTVFSILSTGLFGFGTGSQTARVGIVPPLNTAGMQINGLSLTGSTAVSFINLSGTWNTSGAPTAILLNVTNTNSGAAAKLLDLQIASATIFSVGKDGTVTHADAANMVFGTGTGTKIGTATTQKLGFYNATPVARPVLATGAGATVDNVITVLQTLGLVGQT